MLINRQVALLFMFMIGMICQLVSAQSLTQLRVGIRVNLADSRLIGSSIVKNEFLLRPTFGLDILKPINNSLQITGQILYSTYGNVEHVSGIAAGERYITKYHYLTVPIILRFSRKASRLSVNIGAQWGYLLGKDYVHINSPILGNSTSSLVGPRLKHIDVGAVVGLGYRFSKHFYGDFRYYQSIEKLFSDYRGIDPSTGTGNITVEGLRVYNQSVSVGTTYYF